MMILNKAILPPVRRLLGLAILAGMTIGGYTAENAGRDRVNVGAARNWKIIPEFFPVQSGTPSGTNRVKTLISGASARLNRDETLTVQSMWLGSFDRDGSTNLFATAPECLVRLDNQSASSPGPLEIHSGDGKMTISGKGFYCQLTNVILVISNDVSTLIQQDLWKESGQAERPLLANLTPDPGEAEFEGATNGTLRILADHFVYYQASNLVHYTGNVRATDAVYTLNSQELGVTLATNGNVQQIEAWDGVLLASTDGTRQVTGSRARYVLQAGEEHVEVTGAPVQWQDGARSGEGSLFLLEPGRRLLLSPGPSKFRLPKSDIWQAPFEGTNQPPRTPDSTNEWVEIASGYFATETVMVDTNRSYRTLLASNRVEIVSLADKSVSTGDFATYDESTGIFALHRNARWEDETGRLVEGEDFFFHETNQTFHVRSNSHVRLPLSSLGTNSAWSGFLASPASETQSRTNQPQVLDVRSEHARYSPERLEFGPQARLQIIEADRLNARMRCEMLTMWQTNNQVRQIDASQDVFLEQLPVRNSLSNLVTKTMGGEFVTMWVRTNGLMDRLVARTNVVIRQVEQTWTNALVAMTNELSADQITVYFRADTNAVERIVADGNVIIRQPSGLATCDRAVYTDSTHILILSGDVLWESTRGDLRYELPAFIMKNFNLWAGPVNRLEIPLGDAQQPGRSEPTPPSIEGLVP